MTPFIIEESSLNLGGPSDAMKLGSYHRAHRTMSCPARLKVEEESSLFKRAASNFAVTGLKLSKLRRDFLPTIKTLSMLFLYLLMSSPLYISAAVHSRCSKSECRQFEVCVIIFYNLSMLGLVVYPYFWLLLDRQFAQRVYQICQSVATWKFPKLESCRQ